MRFRTTCVVLLAVGLAGCQPQLPFAGGGEAAPEPAAALERGRVAEPASEEPSAERPTETAGVAVESELQDLLRSAGQETICRTFVRKIAEAAVEHGSDVDAFLGVLQEEFIGGTDDPFEMKQGLRTGEWNQRYFYAGHGGFRSEYDDAQRYPRGGNHQPGHFIAVLSVAARFGEEQARIAIAYAGDYEPGQEDDLRLSNVAIPLGAGLSDRTIAPADVARRAAQLCR